MLALLMAEAGMQRECARGRRAHALPPFTAFRDVTTIRLDIDDSFTGDAPTATRRTVGELIAPLRALHAELADRWRVSVDVVRARARIREGHTGYDPLDVIAAAGDLIVPYLRAVRAIELAGLVSDASIVRARERRFEVLATLRAWVAGERRSPEPERVATKLAITLVGGSILQRASRTLGEALPLDRWSRPTCPCCGGAAELAIADAADRLLVCSRCDAGWRSYQPGCVGCGADAEPLVSRVRAPEVGYYLVVCHGCGRYLKERPAEHPLDPLLERILTAELDAAAERRGLRL